MTGIEIIKAADTTVEQIADIIAEHCPPVTLEHCDKLSCRACWLAWLTSGEAAKETGPSDKQTAPDEEGLHPNLVEMYARAHRRIGRTSEEMLHAYATCNLDATQHPPGQQHA